MWHKCITQQISILLMWIALWEYAECSEYGSDLSYRWVQIHINPLTWLHMFTVHIKCKHITWDHINWGQTLPLFHKKMITFLMNALLFSALNICTVMSYFMCLNVATFSVSNCLQDFKMRYPCLCLLWRPWGGQCELGKGSKVQLWYLRKMSSYCIFFLF